MGLSKKNKFFAWEGANYALVAFSIAQIVSPSESVQKFSAEAYSLYPEKLVIILRDEIFMGTWLSFRTIQQGLSSRQLKERI